eukprot:GSMAST32.ASY1.ANO1.524.1 assembled CDS
MGIPQYNIAAYKQSAVTSHIGKLRGRLMIIHNFLIFFTIYGLLDENVHFQHSAQLVSALTAAHKLYDLLIFPDERHSPRLSKNKSYLLNRVVDFFQKTFE